MPNSTQECDGVFSAIKDMPRIFAFFLFIVVLFNLMLACGCASRHAPPRPAHPGSLAEAVVQTARSQVGTPYKRAGTSPHAGFDCSGLVQWIYGQYGYTLPRTSKSLMREGTPVAVQDLRAGDLVFFRIGKNGSMHVGIATGQGSFIHSPKPGRKVREENLFAPYWAQRKIAVRRIF